MAMTDLTGIAGRAILEALMVETNTEKFGHLRSRALRKVGKAQLGGDLFVVM